MDAQPARIRHRFGTLPAESQPQRDFIGFASPGLAAVFVRLGERVVAPTHGDIQRLHPRRHQHADADGGREEAASRRPAIRRGLFRQSRHGGRLVQLLLFVRIRVLIRRRIRWNEEPGEIPVRRPHPIGNALLGEIVTGGWADEV